MRDDEGRQPTNREKSRRPKLGHAYCGGCDGSLVGDGEKCTRCGWVNRHFRAPARDARRG